MQKHNPFIEYELNIIDNLSTNTCTISIVMGVFLYGVQQAGEEYMYLLVLGYIILGRFIYYFFIFFLAIFNLVFLLRLFKAIFGVYIIKFKPKFEKLLVKIVIFEKIK